MSDLIARLRSQDVADFTPAEIDDLTDEAADALQAVDARIAAMEVDIAENDGLIDSLRDRVAALEAQIAAAEEQEPVGVAGNMPGTEGFTMAAFKAADVPVGTNLYTHHLPSDAEGWRKDAEQTDREIVRALQKALFYWMPRIAGEDSPAGQKAAEHAYLLIGLDDNLTECWGDQILHYVGIMNRQQEKLELVLRDAGCEDEADHLEFIEKLADCSADADRYRFLRDDNDWHQNDRYWEAISAGGEKLDKTIDAALAQQEKP